MGIAGCERLVTRVLAPSQHGFVSIGLQFTANGAAPPPGYTAPAPVPYGAPMPQQYGAPGECVMCAPLLAPLNIPENSP